MFFPVGINILPDCLFVDRKAANKNGMVKNDRNRCLSITVSGVVVESLEI
jgi:hypothetical protein